MSSSSSTLARLARERQTIECMLQIYCRKKHKRAAELCNSCRDLLDYALQRIDRCPFKDDKPTCRQCPVHCYKKDRREQIRQVMAFAGPWMLLYHPGLTVMHYWDGRAGRREKVVSR